MDPKRVTESSASRFARLSATGRKRSTEAKTKRITSPIGRSIFGTPKTGTKTAQFPPGTAKGPPTSKETNARSTRDATPTEVKKALKDINLSGPDYKSWRDEILAGLAVMDGKLPDDIAAIIINPDGDEVDDLKTNRELDYRRATCTLFSLLMRATSENKSLKNLVRSKKAGVEAWTCILSKYSTVSHRQLASLLKQFGAFTIYQGESIMDLFTRYRFLLNDMADAGHTPMAAEVAIRIVDALSPFDFPTTFTDKCEALEDVDIIETELNDFLRRQKKDPLQTVGPPTAPAKEEPKSGKTPAVAYMSQTSEEHRKRIDELDTKLSAFMTQMNAYMRNNGNSRGGRKGGNRNGRGNGNGGGNGNGSDNGRGSVSGDTPKNCTICDGLNPDCEGKWFNCSWRPLSKRERARKICQAIDQQKVSAFSTIEVINSDDNCLVTSPKHLLDTAASDHFIDEELASPDEKASTTTEKLQIAGFNGTASNIAKSGKFGQQEVLYVREPPANLHSLCKINAQTKQHSLITSTQSFLIPPTAVPLSTPAIKTGNVQDNVLRATPSFIRDIKEHGAQLSAENSACTLGDHMETSTANNTPSAASKRRHKRKERANVVSLYGELPFAEKSTIKYSHPARVVGGARTSDVTPPRSPRRSEAYRINAKETSQRMFKRIVERLAGSEDDDSCDTDIAFRAVRHCNNRALRWHRKHGHPPINKMRKQLHMWESRGLTDSMLRKQGKFTKKDLAAMPKLQSSCAGCMEGVHDKTTHHGAPPAPNPGRWIVDAKQRRKTGRGGYKHAIVYVNDSTGKSYVYMVKDLLATTIVRTFNLTRAQISADGAQPMTLLRIDPGKSFLNDSLEGAAVRPQEDGRPGVHIESGATEAHYFTGKVERRIRELTQKARVVLADAKLPDHFFLDAMLYANDAFNNLPCSTHGDLSTPEQKHRNDPMYEPPEPYPFGATCYVRLLDQETSSPVTNSNPRSYPAIYLRTHKNGYRHYVIYDPVRKRVFTRDNVKIDESIELITADRIAQMKQGNFRPPFQDELPSEEEDDLPSDFYGSSSEEELEGEADEVDIPAITEPVMRLKSKKMVTFSDSMEKNEFTKKMSRNTVSTTKPTKPECEEPLHTDPVKPRRSNRKKKDDWKPNCFVYKAIRETVNANDHWGTPVKLKQALDDIFRFTYDPTPANGHIKSDGFEKPFEKSTFANVPYSQLEQWTKKFKEEYQDGNSFVALLPARFPKYYHEEIRPCDPIMIPIKGRLAFEDFNKRLDVPKRSNFDSVLYIFGYENLQKNINLKDMCVETTDGSNFTITFERAKAKRRTFTAYKTEKVSVADIQADRWKNDKRLGRDIKIPKTLQRALAKSCPEHEDWEVAFKNELQNLITLGVFTPARLPEYKKVIATRWVMQISTNSDGTVKKFKVRFVGKGFLQVPGRDYDANDCAAPVARFESHRMMLAMAAARKMQIRYVDFKGAFLQGTLKEKLYVNPPPMITMPPGCNTMLLNKSVPGLKQSAMVWYKKLKSAFESAGFITSPHDPCVFMFDDGKDQIVVSTHVDDGLVVTTDASKWLERLEIIKKTVRISETDVPRKFLGMEITIDEEGIHLTQSEKISEIIALLGCEKKVEFPAVKTEHPDDDEPYTGGDFHSHIGMLAYVARGTRPDIIFEVMHLCRFQNKPKMVHKRKLRRIVDYLANTPDFGLVYKWGNGKFDVEGFVDADFAECEITRKSTTGFVFMANNSPIAWCSRLQKLVTLSTTEAEYVAASEAVCEGLWIRKQLAFLGLCGPKDTIIMREDNQGTIARTMRPEYQFGRRSKHIEVKYHHLSDLVRRGEAELVYVPTDVNSADVMTKSLSGAEFKRKRPFLVSRCTIRS